MIAGLPTANNIDLKRGFPIDLVNRARQDLLVNTLI
jgi:hypothetical protein